MSDSAEHELSHDEPTGRTKRIELVEVDAQAALKRAQHAEESVKRIRFWVSVGFGLCAFVAAATYTVMGYLGGLAKASTVNGHALRLERLEQIVGRDREDVKWIKRAMWSLVSGRGVPPPPPKDDDGE